MKALNLTGQRFGMLLALKPCARGDRRTRWVCVCDCGVTKSVPTDHLVRKRQPVRSCGCKQGFVTHGMSNSKLYRTWMAMRARCQNPSQRAYRHYGGRGISVCPRWNESFEAFVSDMGAPPFDRAEIDRIDVNGDYEPENCRWADRKTQMNNRRNNFRVEFRGETITLTQLAERTGVNVYALRSRLLKGETAETAVASRRSRRDVA